MDTEVKYETCESCGGFGDHGIEEETGCLYTCYCCYGTGKVRACSGSPEQQLGEGAQPVSQ
jgi:hypothetical protein